MSIRETIAQSATLTNPEKTRVSTPKTAAETSSETISPTTALTFRRTTADIVCRTTCVTLRHLNPRTTTQAIDQTSYLTVAEMTYGTTS